MVHCAWKVRFYPTPEQQRALAQWFGYSQFVWNSALESQRKAYARRGSVLPILCVRRFQFGFLARCALYAPVDVGDRLEPAFLAARFR